MARRFVVLASVLAVTGVLGFVSSGPIFGLFETTPALNAFHLAAAGAAAIAARRGIRSMRAWGQGLGYAFAALAIAGFATDSESVANMLPLSTVNAWFHLLMALVFLYHALLAPPTL